MLSYEVPACLSQGNVRTLQIILHEPSTQDASYDSVLLLVSILFKPQEQVCNDLWWMYEQDTAEWQVVCISVRPSSVEYCQSTACTLSVSRKGHI